MERRTAARIIGFCFTGVVVLTEPFTGWANGLLRFGLDHRLSALVLVVGALALLYGFLDDVLMMAHVIRPRALRHDVTKLLETVGWIPEDHPLPIAADFAWQVNGTLKASPDENGVRRVLNEISVLYNKKTKCLQMGVRMTLQPSTRAFIDGLPELERMSLLMVARGQAATRGAAFHCEGDAAHTTAFVFQRLIWVSEGLSDASFYESLQSCKSSFDAVNDLLVVGQMPPAAPADEHDAPIN